MADKKQGTGLFGRLTSEEGVNAANKMTSGASRLVTRGGRRDTDELVQELCDHGDDIFDDTVLRRGR